VIQNEYKTINEDTKKFHFSFPFPEGCYILTKNTLIEIEKLEYEIPYVTRTQEIRITDDSENRLILLDSNGSPLKLLTDKELRKYKLDDSKNLQVDRDFIQ
jgi:hypothetical protein